MKEGMSGSPGHSRHQQRQRAVWALLLLLPAPSIGTAASLLLWPESAASKALFIVCKLWVVVWPLGWLLLVDRQRISLSLPQRGGFGMAALSGCLIAIMILGVYAMALKTGLVGPGAIAASATKTGLNHLGVYIAGAVYWITLNSLMEEYVWRWFVYQKFEVLIGGNLAVMAASLCFTAHHVIALAAQFNWQVTFLGSLGVFVGGVTWSWLYGRYQSIWPCYLSHAIVDAPIFWIGYDLIFRRAG